MEKTIELNSWEEFKHKVAKDKKPDSLANNGHHSAQLFRGQPNSTFQLLTTLDRRIDRTYTFESYFNLALRIKPQIETHTGNNWELPEFPKLSDWSKEYDSFGTKEFPASEFLIYLRHHGFPSPLLDWTASPFIAAFFAFSERNTSENVAIYRFQEYAGVGKTSANDEPRIISLGPYVKGHARHFWQQSQYTVCGKFEEFSWSFAKHEEVFNLNIPNQDILTKFILPASERDKVLTELNAFNLNSFSLFRNEESLLETIAFKEIQK